MKKAIVTPLVGIFALGTFASTAAADHDSVLENVRAIDSNASEGTITLGERDEEGDLDTWTVNAPEGTDFEAVLGKGGTVEFNSDNDIVDYSVDEEDVLYGAVTDVGFDEDDTPVEIEMDGEWYDLEDGYLFRYQDEVDLSLASEGGPNADYAKFVFNSSGEVAFYDAYDGEAAEEAAMMPDEMPQTGMGGTSNDGWFKNVWNNITSFLFN